MKEVTTARAALESGGAAFQGIWVPSEAKRWSERAYFSVGEPKNRVVSEKGGGTRAFYDNILPQMER
jgi:hypothetical protein